MANQRKFLLVKAMATVITTVITATAMSPTFAASADMATQMAVVNEQGTGPMVGQILISESPYGLVFTPSLKGLPPGLHGFMCMKIQVARRKRKTAKKCLLWLRADITTQLQPSSTVCPGVMAIWAICPRYLWMPKGMQRNQY